MIGPRSYPVPYPQSVSSEDGRWRLEQCLDPDYDDERTGPRQIVRLWRNADGACALVACHVFWRGTPRFTATDLTLTLDYHREFDVCVSLLEPLTFTFPPSLVCAPVARLNAAIHELACLEAKPPEPPPPPPRARWLWLGGAAVAWCATIAGANQVARNAETALLFPLVGITLLCLAGTIAMLWKTFSLASARFAKARK